MTKPKTSKSTSAPSVPKFIQDFIKFSKDYESESNVTVLIGNPSQARASFEACHRDVFAFLTKASDEVVMTDFRYRTSGYRFPGQTVAAPENIEWFEFMCDPKGPWAKALEHIEIIRDDGLPRVAIVHNPAKAPRAFIQNFFVATRFCREYPSNFQTWRVLRELVGDVDAVVPAMSLMAGSKTYRLNYLPNNGHIFVDSGFEGRWRAKNPHVFADTFKTVNSSAMACWSYGNNHGPDFYKKGLKGVTSTKDVKTPAFKFNIPGGYTFESVAEAVENYFG